MKEFFGWTMDSDMASVYVHISGRDTDEAILRMYGKLGENEKREYEQPKTQPCQICGHENSPEADFCVKNRWSKTSGMQRPPARKSASVHCVGSDHRSETGGILL
jgi:hypothetical protein